MNFQQWVANTNGRGIDVDNSYGNQCWDLWSLFAQQVLGVPQSATSTRAGGSGTHRGGYACEIWHQFASSPLPGWFTTVPASVTALPGDVAIWEWGTGVGPSSHVAIVVADEGRAIRTLTQNPGVTNLRSFTKAGLLGYLRPKDRAPFGGGVVAAPSRGDHIAAEGNDWTYWVPSTQDQATVQGGLNIAGYPVAVDGNLTSAESVQAIKLLCGKFGFYDLRYLEGGQMTKNLCYGILLMAQAHGGYAGRMDFQIDGHVWAAFDAAIRATARVVVSPPPVAVDPEPVVEPEPIVEPIVEPVVEPEPTPATPPQTDDVAPTTPPKPPRVFAPIGDTTAVFAAIPTTGGEIMNGGIIGAVKSIPFWNDLLTRALNTFLQVSLAAVGVGATGVMDLDYVGILNLAAGGALVSVLTSFVRATTPKI